MKLTTRILPAVLIAALTVATAAAPSIAVAAPLPQRPASSGGGPFCLWWPGAGLKEFALDRERARSTCRTMDAAAPNSSLIPNP